MPGKFGKSCADWKEKLLSPHEHKDHRSFDPAPDTTVINREDNTRQGTVESLRDLTFRFDAAARQSERAALWPRNHTMYFKDLAKVQSKLAASGTSMLSHIGAKDDTAKAHSYDCFSDAVRMSYLAPTKAIDFKSMQTHLFAAGVFGKYPDLERLYLAKDSKLPDEYYRLSSILAYKDIDGIDQDNMEYCLKKAKLDSDAHYAKFDNNRSFAASSTGEDQETERPDDSEQGPVRDENHFELDPAMMA